MSEWISVAEIFGENVFNDAVMQERLPKKTYKELKKDDRRKVKSFRLQQQMLLHMR
mgnify:CR=1 FL=1